MANTWVTLNLKVISIGAWNTAVLRYMVLQDCNSRVRLQVTYYPVSKDLYLNKVFDNTCVHVLFALVPLLMSALYRARNSCPFD